MKGQLNRERVQSATSWKALREAITYILDSIELKRNGVRLSRPFAHAVAISTCTWHVVGRARKPRPDLYSRPGFYLLYGSADPRRLNETGFYLNPASIRNNTDISAVAMLCCTLCNVVHACIHVYNMYTCTYYYIVLGDCWQVGATQLYRCS